MAPLQASDGWAAACTALQAARLHPAWALPSEVGSRKKDQRKPYSKVRLRRILQESARYHSKSCQISLAVTLILFSDIWNCWGFEPVPGIRSVASGFPVAVTVPPMAPSNGVTTGPSGSPLVFSILALFP